MTPTTCRPRSIGLGLAILVLATSATAESWTSLPLLERASFLRVATCPTQSLRVFASGSGGGVYRSDNRGTTWTWVGNELPRDVPVSALAASPLDEDVVFAAMSGAGLYRTTDGGATWQRSDVGLSGQPARALALDALDPLNAYAGTAGGVGRGVYRSTDGGATWAIRSSGLLAAGIEELAMNSGNSALLLAATPDGIARSSDAGESWNWVRLGSATQEIEWSVSTPNVVRVGENGKLMVSTDAGVTWQLKPSPWIDKLAVDPNDADHIVLANSQACGWALASATCGYPYYGTRITNSTDGGGTWEVVLATCDCNPPGDVTFDPTADGLVYVSAYGATAGTGEGIRRSSAAGAAGSWMHYNAGVHMVPLQSVAVGPEGTLYAREGANAPLHVSSDGGSTWTARESPNWDSYVTRSFEVQASVPGLLLEAGEWFSFDIGGQYLARSTDGGLTWSDPYGLPDGLPWEPIRRVQSNYGTGEIIYAWTGNVWGSVESLYRSDDFGSSYAWVSSGPVVVDAVVRPDDPRSLLVAHAGVDVVRASTDGGSTWTPRSIGLPSTTPVRLLMDPAVPDHLLVAFESGPPYESLDGGASWTPTAADPGSASVLDAAWDVAGGQINIFLATNAGVWIPDVALTTDGLESFGFTSIAYSRAHEMLLAATGERGLFALPLATVATGAPVASGDPAAGLLTVAPNPFRAVTTVRFSLDRSGAAARVDVYDAAGRRVRTLLDRTLPAGQHAVGWDGRQSDGRPAAAGVYFLRLDTPGGAVMRRAVLLR